MAVFKQTSHVDFRQNELRQAVLELLTADPGTPIDGQVWFRTDQDRIGVETSTGTERVAYLSDLEAFGALVGTHDASTGIPSAGSGPAGAIRAGDYWVVSADGTIAGIGGDDALTPGDILIATVDGAASAADFTGVEQNLDLTGITRCEKVTLSLAAGTPTVVATTTTFTDVHGVDVYDSAGDKFGLCVNVSGTTVTVESNEALANIMVAVSGS